MAPSLRPRHPADIAADAAAARRRIGQKVPPQLFKGQKRLLFAAIPAIITAAAVYVALVLVDRLLQRHPFFSGASTAPSDEVLVRGVDGVVQLPPVVEQIPPPSPDLLAEQAEQARRERERQAAPEATTPVPVLEPDPLVLEPAPEARLTPGVGPAAAEIVLPAPTSPPVTAPRTDAGE